MLELTGIDLLDTATMAAPPAHHLVDMLGENRRLFYLELASDGVVMERFRRL